MKKTNITLSIALAAVFSSSVAFAEAEVTGKIVHETAKFTNAGSTIGAAAAHGKDVFKSETSARIYIDGAADELKDGATYHVELNLMKDGKAGAKYDGNESYTQRDALREAYVDMEQGDWSIRAGKQQVVWGTADGMKLLDMINPSDYGEMAQNQMEDSRIPVWMVNAETTNADGSEFQVIVSQPKENVFAGLNRNTKTGIRTNANGTSDLTTDGTDTGHAFIMKGPDTITGAVNGFLNIAPDLGSIAAGFGGQFTNAGLFANTGMTVQMFNTMTNEQLQAQNWPASAVMLKDMVYGTNNSGANTTLGKFDGTQIMGAFAGPYNTNLNAATTAANWGVDKDSAFEYMGNTSFGTFDAFWNVRSEYTYNMPKNSDFDLALRTKKSLASGLNYSLNASYNYDKNPIINLSWRGATGDLLTQTVTDVTNLGADQAVGGTGQNADYVTKRITLADAAGNAYGGVAVSGADGEMGSMVDEASQAQMADNDWSKSATLRFEQEVKRVVNIGGSFDTAIETAELGPVVIRGEALYTKGAYSPIIDKTKLGYGDLINALSMQKGDRMKFVLGADITAMTNMLVSAQFIQDSDLDFVDGVDRYTADYATMHLTNGFNKGIKNKNYYSLFFSKPFGASGEHRWNNIFMFEENGGKWNRLDAEFSIDDDTQATVEYNKYWGNVNTQFGQLEKSSSIQVGVKYSF